MFEEIFNFDGDGGRVDKVLAHKYVNDFSRVRIQNAIEAGDILINGSVVTKRYNLKAGDLVHVRLVLSEEVALKPVEMPLDILYEDEYYVAANKAHGQTVHPGNGTGEDTLAHALLAHCNLSNSAGANRPGVVHRIDKDTSGVIIFAKTDAAYFALTKLFAARDVTKIYLAVVEGTPRLNSGVIEAPIGRSDFNKTSMCVKTSGKNAKTSWELVEKLGNKALLRCQIYTGRTHQIRVHLKHIGHPIVGDVKYNKTSTSNRLLLHANKLEFIHPFTSTKVSIIAKLPADWQFS